MLCCVCCRGDTHNSKTRGTAFVVYEDVFDAMRAVDHLNGFNVCGLYLNVLYYRPSKAAQRRSVEQEKQELESLKRQFRTLREKTQTTEEQAS